MKSLVIVCMIVAASVVVADEKAEGSVKQEKRHAYHNGAVQPPHPPVTPAALVPNNVPVQPYQPNYNYLPTCAIQPYGNPSFPVYQPPYYNGPADSSYGPQYQPPQYPIPYQPSQYPVPYQYPVAYQPSSQYLNAAYQPQQTANPAATPYSYSYFPSTANNNAENVLSSIKKK